MNRLLLAAVFAIIPLSQIQAFAEDTETETATVAEITVAPEEASWYGSQLPAIGGKDVVAFFDENAEIAVEGSDAFTTTWQNATWQFSSEENRDRFIENPEKYAPQFGGYCPVALADGDLKIGNAGQFTVEDDKLYLNFDDDARYAFRENKGGIVTKARVNWNDLF